MVASLPCCLPLFVHCKLLTCCLCPGGDSVSKTFIHQGAIATPPVTLRFALHVLHCSTFHPCQSFTCAAGPQVVLTMKEFVRLPIPKLKKRRVTKRASNTKTCACRPDVNHLSAANWGIIEVKGAWQLSLPDNMSLGEALDHPDYSREVLPALQQVCLMVSTNLQSGMCIVMQ